MCAVRETMPTLRLHIRRFPKHSKPENQRACATLKPQHQHPSLLTRTNNFNEASSGLCCGYQCSDCLIDAVLEKLFWSARLVHLAQWRTTELLLTMLAECVSLPGCSAASGAACLAMSFCALLTEPLPPRIRVLVQAELLQWINSLLDLTLSKVEQARPPRCPSLLSDTAGAALYSR